MRLLLCLLLLGGCLSPRTPESACQRLLSGVREGDGAQAFDALLKSTQWSLDAVADRHRKMRALIERDYPERERPAALARLFGASASSGRDLFHRLYPGRYAADFQRRLGTGPLAVTPAGAGAALCAQRGKEPFRFQRDQKGRWGLSELDREWEQAKLRAVHDLDTVRENARLYRQPPAGL